MKILFLSDNFPPEVNAPSARVFERACYWVQDHHDVSILTCAPNFPLGKVYEGYANNWVQKETMEGVRVIRVKTFMAPNKGFFLRIIDFLSYMVMSILVGSFQSKPDVIVATSPQFFAAIGGWILSRIKRVPFIFEIGDLWPASIKGLGLMGDSFVYRVLEKLELFLYKHSALIIAQTPSFKENLVSRGINPQKIKVILNGVDLKRYQPIVQKDKEILETYQLKDKIVVGYIGTHGMSHDLKKILDVVKIVEARMENITFLFVGEGAEKDDVVRYAKLNHLKSVHFLPLQPKAQIHRWWSVCDIALVPLKDLDIFKTVIPSKIFEVSGLGLPIFLVAPEGEASRLLQEEKFGIHVLPQSIENIAKQLIELASNQGLQKKLRKATLKVAQRYSRERQAREFLECLQGSLVETDKKLGLEIQ